MPGQGRFDIAQVGWLRPIAPPIGRCIAILAPHPDDEILGCAGAIHCARTLEPTMVIRVLYLTDGERGVPEAASLADAAATRVVEGYGGLGRLGVESPERGCFPDGALSVGPAEVALTSAFLRATQPEVVMAPVPLDPHSDHRATCAILAHALAGTPSLQASIWLYEVQPCFPMNAIVRIDDAIRAKLDALEAHASQDVQRLCRAASGLAAGRALYAPAHWEYAEAFRVCSGTNFLSLCRSLGVLH
jgi:LmbE family N-acetylglucosaminyl deacetylase